jgi:hypothetical protein
LCIHRRKLFGHACAQYNQTVVSANSPKKQDCQDATKNQKGHVAVIVNENSLKKNAPARVNGSEAFIIPTKVGI